MIVRVIVVQTQRTVRVIYSGSLEPETVTVLLFTLYRLLDSDSEEYGDWRLDRIAHLLTVRLRVRLTFPEE